MHRIATRTALGSSIVALVAVSAVAAAGGASADPRATRGAGTVGTPAGAKYAALGDSYASGESNAPYLAGTDTSTNRCHRSATAYPVLVATRAGERQYDFTACSGATTADLFADSHNGYTPEPAQLDALGPATKLVTLTIGGNDIGFSQIMGACVYADRQRGTRSDCSTGPVAALVDARLAALAGATNGATTPGGDAITPIATVLRRIREAAPRAQIVVTTYPVLVGDVPDGGECRVGGLDVVEAPGEQLPLYVSAVDAAWMTGLVDRLDAVITSAARAAGPRVRVADTRPQLEGHGLCDTGAPWVTPVSGTVSTATGATAVDAASLHPTAAGQEAFYRAVVAAGE